jgi:hypothetical protein
MRFLCDSNWWAFVLRRLLRAAAAQCLKLCSLRQSVASRRWHGIDLRELPDPSPAIRRSGGTVAI